MRTISYKSPLSILFTALLCCACSSQRDTSAKPSVTVSTEPQRWLMEQIVQGRLTVNSIMDKNADAENFDPTVATMQKLESGLAYFTMGHNAFEESIVKRLPGSVTVIDCSGGIALITGGHGHSREGREMPDPHLLSSPANALVMARNMTDALCRLDPDGAELYKKGLTVLTDKIDSLDAYLSERLAPVKGSAFMVRHPSLSYFARDYGLRQIPLGSDGRESTPADLTRSLNAVRSADASLMVVQPHDDADRAASIARQAGVDTIMINTMSYDWMSQLRRLADGIGNHNKQHNEPINRYH